MKVNGVYQVRSENLKPLYNRVLDLIQCFEEFEIEHVYRSASPLPSNPLMQCLSTCL
jgi:hypothetical protein